MGLGNRGWAGAAGSAGRMASGGLAGLLAGAEAVALSAAAGRAGQVGTEQTDTEQAGQKKAEAGKDAAGATLLDKIMLASRIGESAIESLSSSSHVDREQIERRMAATPNEMLFGVPGVIGTALAETMGRAGLRVEQVEVTGIKRADRMTVYNYTLSQKSRAMPLVDLDEVRERLTTIGWVADARVSRRLPDMLVVDIVERKAAAVWQHQGQLMLIDNEGVLLEPVSADAMPDLPLVVGPNANLQTAGWGTGGGGVSRGAGGGRGWPTAAGI